MGNKNFIVFNDSGIKKSVSELMDESSKVKAELFQRFIMKKGINLATFNHFETYAGIMGFKIQRDLFLNKPATRVRNRN